MTERKTEFLSMPEGGTGSGATAEQLAQIAQNTEDIAELKGDITNFIEGQWELILDDTLSEQAELNITFDADYTKLLVLAEQPSDNVYTSTVYTAPHVYINENKKETSPAVSSIFRKYIKPTEAFPNIFTLYTVEKNIVFIDSFITNDKITSMSPTPLASNKAIYTPLSYNSKAISVKSFCGAACGLDTVGTRYVIWGVKKS